MSNPSPYLTAREAAAPSDAPDVLFRADLAKVLRMSLRTLDEVRARHGNLPPEMPRMDDRPRWSKARVLDWMQQTDAAQRFHVAVGRRRR